MSEVTSVQDRSVPEKARAVVVGAGIVGNSLAYHLARLGWRDLILLDKGPLPNPGGSTGHASNFIFPVDHSKEMTALTLDSVRQYQELGAFLESGGIEVARTEERMQELWRRISSAKSWGVDPVSMISPTDIKELVPFVDDGVLLGGFYTPSVGIVDALGACAAMRERSEASGALAVFPETEVVGIDLERGRVRRVRTTGGDVEAEIVIVACGVWSPHVARLAGASVPLTPAVHQMIDVAPVPWFADAKAEIEFPIVRDMDAGMYERQRFERLGGVQQDVRDRPSLRAVGVEPRRPALAVPRARARAGCGVLRGRRLGAAALVRVERRARGRV